MLRDENGNTHNILLKLLNTGVFYNLTDKFITEFMLRLLNGFNLKIIILL